MEEIALKLDENQAWKHGNMTMNRLILMLKFIQALQPAKKDIGCITVPFDLIYVLRDGLTHDFANIGHPMLFAETYIGTKNYRKLWMR